MLRLLTVKPDRCIGQPMLEILVIPLWAFVRMMNTQSLLLVFAYLCCEMLMAALSKNV